MWVLDQQGAGFTQVSEASLVPTQKINAGEPGLAGKGAGVVELNFPSSGDGRGFSLARRLRRQHGATIRLVATGNLIPDQARMAFQCGFDEIRLEDDLVARHSQNAWRQAVGDSATGLYVSNPADRLSAAPGWDQRHQGAVRVKSLTARETFEELQGIKNGKILDVRTDAELQFVGRVNLPNVYYARWKTFPDDTVNDSFVADAQALGLSKNCPLYVLCRSGVRSLHAAQTLRDAGFKDITNISDGFEGDLNALNRRGSINGWKASGLPWCQL